VAAILLRVSQTAKPVSLPITGTTAFPGAFHGGMKTPVLKPLPFMSRPAAQVP